MANTDEDITRQYFKRGAAVEISGNDEGFRGSWYEGTVIRPPAETTTPPSRSKRYPDRSEYRKDRKSTLRVRVEYKNLTEDEAGTKRLREEFDLVQLRPPPPREKRQSFKFNEEVDAYYNDGWWEGVVTAVLGEDKYSVFFRSTRDQMDFKASELRVHREWVKGKWVPPLEEDTPTPPLEVDEKTAAPTELKLNKEIIEHNFGRGEAVEISSDEDGFEGAWFAATVIKKLDEGKYLTEYKHFRNDDDTNFVREEVDSLHIRPCPPDVGLVDHFEVLDEVDALYNDAWWVGVISKVFKNNKYTVYFRGTNENLKFNCSDLRPHQEWINGKWVIASQALKS